MPPTGLHRSQRPHSPAPPPAAEPTMQRPPRATFRADDPLLSPRPIRPRKHTRANLSAPTSPDAGRVDHRTSLTEPWTSRLVRVVSSSAGQGPWTSAPLAKHPSGSGLPPARPHGLMWSGHADPKLAQPVWVTCGRSGPFERAWGPGAHDLWLLVVTLVCRLNRTDENGERGVVTRARRRQTDLLPKR